MNKDEVWYVIYTKSRHEKILAEQLEEAGHVVYLPLIKKISKWSDRKKQVEVPLFNSYVFIKGVNEKTAMKDFKGFVTFLNYNGKPAIVRQHEIDTLKTILKHGYDVSESTAAANMKSGNKVMVIGGPLKGMQGELISVSDADWFLIVFENFKNSLQIKLPPSVLRKMD